MRNRSLTAGVILIGAGVVLAVVAALLWGLGVWGASSGMSAGTDRFMERHFLEQMIPHHEDAVAMAELALTRAEHPELRELAVSIIREQSREIEQMRDWYSSWYGLEAPKYDLDDPRRGGRSGSMMGGMMGGMMADGTDLEILETSPDFDREFIEQMIPHHQMGVMMARMVLSRSDRPEIDGLARAIIRTQTDEIERMADWYRDWFE